MGPIRFPNLGFEISVGKEFKVFGFAIAFYGITMALAMISGALIAYAEAKRTRQKVDDYIDYTLFGILGGVIGARIYYVAFSWDQYKNNLLEIFNLRGGGIAIYGGVIGAVIVAIVFCKIKKMKFWKFADTAVLGLLLGQIIGRWGNFFNREAYGSFEYTFINAKYSFANVGIFKLFAMQIPVKDATVVTDTIIKTVDGIRYVEVVPTFLLEGTLNLILLALLIIFRDKKKFYGETFLRYLMGYGIIRFFVEGFRMDQLQFKGIAVSQVLGGVLFLGCLVFMIVKRIMLKGKPSQIDALPSKETKDEEVTSEENSNNESEDVSETSSEEEIIEDTNDSEITENNTDN